MQIPKMLISRKGALDDLALSVVIFIVTLFVGIFLISKVSTITAINNSSDFYTVWGSLVSNTGTMYDVLILVGVVVAIGVAIGVLKGVGGGGGFSPSSAV
jgi:hypothetical protein